MNPEENKAVEYLKTRLYGNKGCKYIDVAQEDLRIFIKLVDRLQKENESLQKTYDDCYCKYKHYKQFESISIQKVKDKIRKNEEIIDISNDGDLIHELFQKNKVYEELLKEGE